MRRALVTVMTLILLAAPVGATASHEKEALETLISESAETPTEHAALGRYYRSRATLARENADQQERMGRSALYVAGNAGHQRYQKERRGKVARLLRDQADAYDARALIHETAAREAASPEANG